MATLVSAGVEVTVVDESAYGAPGAGTVPLLPVSYTHLTLPTTPYV